MRCIWQENKLHVWILLQPIGFFNWTDLCVTSQILLYATNRSRKWYSACRHKQNNPKYRRSVLKLRDWELGCIDVLPTSIVKINELRRQVMVAISPKKHNNRKHRNIGQSTTIRRGSRPCQSYCQNLFVHKRLNWKKLFRSAFSHLSQSSAACGTTKFEPNKSSIHTQSTYIK